MTNQTLSIALIQQSFTDNIENNWQRLESAVEKASTDANLVMLPELHNSLYFCQDQNLLL